SGFILLRYSSPSSSARCDNCVNGVCDRPGSSCYKTGWIGPNCDECVRCPGSHMVPGSRPICVFAAKVGEEIFVVKISTTTHYIIRARIVQDAEI
ncbi:unnamed protein product, partial [Onchocerca ochengi]